MNLKHLLSRILKEPDEGKDGSVQIDDSSVIEAFISNPDNTFLVSFPRTGSHWLRMIMELYFERPSLVRVFYYPESKDYLTLHTHDMELDIERNDVIYLYRDPVDTVYSQLNYHKEPLDELGRIVHWADLYGWHLDKWLIRERFTRHKTVLTYEGLKKDMAAEFSRVALHFGQTLNEGRLKQAAARITKEEVKRKTAHDEQVVKLDGSYASTRELFRKSQGALVRDTVFKGRPLLEEFFAEKMRDYSL